MNKFLFLVYGLVAYLLFLGTFLYSIGFVGNVYVPKSIDSGTPGPLAASLIIDLLLLSIFALQHSVMARPNFKAWWTRVVPRAAERSTYVVFASLALVLLFALWQPLPRVIWQVSSGIAPRIIGAVGWFGWALVLSSTLLINHWELFGVQQTLAAARGREAEAPQFRTPLLYKLVRHPLYLGFLIAFWATPIMTLGHLVFSIATTGYIFIGASLEEHDLAAHFGQQYAAYRARVSMILPWPPRRT